MITVITGGAGFIGSHLCERFLSEGHEVICVDNLITGSCRNIAAPARQPRFRFVDHDVSEPIEIDGPVDNVLHFASPGQPGRLPEPSDPDAQGRLAGHAQRARPGQGQGRALPAGQHSRGLRRSRGPPAARGLLGPRQPDRPPRLLRRGQALRRGDHDGLPPLPRRQHPHRPHLQHLRRAHAAQRRPRAAQLHVPGPPRRADHRLRRRLADPQLLLRRRPGRGDLRLLNADFSEPVNIGNPAEITVLQLAQEIIALVEGTKSTIVYEDLPQDDPKRRKPDITRAQTLLGWEPTVDRSEGLKRSLEYFRQVV